MWRDGLGAREPPPPMATSSECSTAMLEYLCGASVSLFQTVGGVACVVLVW